jgi:hypothetical protein
VAATACAPGLAGERALRAPQQQRTDRDEELVAHGIAQVGQTPQPPDLERGRVRALDQLLAQRRELRGLEAFLLEPEQQRRHQPERPRGGVETERGLVRPLA